MYQMNFLNIYKPNEEIKDFTLPIVQNNSSLFILHPIYKKISTKAPNKNELNIKYYFFSQNYIYISFALLVTYSLFDNAYVKI